MHNWEVKLFIRQTRGWIDSSNSISSPHCFFPHIDVVFFLCIFAFAARCSLQTHSPQLSPWCVERRNGDWGVEVDHLRGSKKHLAPWSYWAMLFTECIKDKSLCQVALAQSLSVVWKLTKKNPLLCELHSHCAAAASSTSGHVCVCLCVLTCHSLPNSSSWQKHLHDCLSSVHQFTQLLEVHFLNMGC